MQHHEIIILAKLPQGQEATIISTTANFQAAKRLADMGLTPGTTVRMIRKTILGPMEIKVRGTNMVLGRGIATKILARKT